MTFDESEYREEQISSHEQIQRLESLMSLGANGVIDGWLLERMNYTAKDGVIHGVATFVKVKRLTDMKLK